MFDDELIAEYMEWKNANRATWSWWNYVNMKSDLQTALGFAKFFYPDVVEVDGYFLLKDKFNGKAFDGWKQDCKGDKQSVEKMMNLYEVNDFFHINQRDGETDEQVKALGDAVKLFWTLSFKHRFPDRNIVVDLFEEYDDAFFITVYEES